MKALLILSLAIFISSCATDTKFHGEAHMTPVKCEAKCEEWGMDLNGMVAIGEYSDACVCAKKRPKPKPAPGPAPESKPEPLPPVEGEPEIQNDAIEEDEKADLNGQASAIGAAVVGGIMQKRAADEMNAVNPALGGGMMMMPVQ